MLGRYGRMHGSQGKGIGDPTVWIEMWDHAYVRHPVNVSDCPKTRVFMVTGSEPLSCVLVCKCGQKFESLQFELLYLLSSMLIRVCCGVDSSSFTCEGMR